MLKLYIAGPMDGVGYDELTHYHSDIVSKLSNYRVFHPLMNREQNPTQIHKCLPDDYRLVFDRDKWMVRQVDIVFVDFSRGKGEKVSIGTTMEMAWAHEFGKKIVTVLPSQNIHDHAFIRECSTAIFTTTDEAVGYLNQFINYFFKES